MSGKLGLTASAALLRAFIFAAAQQPMNVYAGFRKEIRGGSLSVCENVWGDAGVVKQGDRNSVVRDRCGNLGRGRQKKRGK
jgi:hypothetical protein